MTLLHIGWCYLFIVHLNLKVFGAAIALNTTYLSCYLCQEIYVRFLRNAVDKIYFEERTAPFFSQVTLQEWMEFLKYGVPGTCMQCFEWWAFEVIAIFAGIISVTDLAAQVVIINIIGLVYMIPLGI